MKKQILTRLWKTLNKAMKTFAAHRYGKWASVFLTAATSLCVNAEGALVAGQAVAKGYAYGYLKENLMPEEMRREVLVLEFFHEAAKILFFCAQRARQNGVAAFRLGTSRRFEAANERFQTSQAANRKFQTFAGLGTKVNADLGINAHSGAVWNAKHDGFQIAWTAC